jgi:hypothetical protein
MTARARSPAVADRAGRSCRRGRALLRRGSSPQPQEPGSAGRTSSRSRHRPERPRPEWLSPRPGFRDGADADVDAPQTAAPPRAAPVQRSFPSEPSVIGEPSHPALRSKPTSSWESPVPIAESTSMGVRRLESWLLPPRSLPFRSHGPFAVSRPRDAPGADLNPATRGSSPESTGFIVRKARET